MRWCVSDDTIFLNTPHTTCISYLMVFSLLSEGLRCSKKKSGDQSSDGGSTPVPLILSQICHAISDCSHCEIVLI